MQIAKQSSIFRLIPLFALSLISTPNSPNSTVTEMMTGRGTTWGIGLNYVPAPSRQGIADYE